MWYRLFWSQERHIQHVIPIGQIEVYVDGGKIDKLRNINFIGQLNHCAAITHLSTCDDGAGLFNFQLSGMERFSS